MMTWGAPWSAVHSVGSASMSLLAVPLLGFVVVATNEASRRWMMLAMRFEHGGLGVWIVGERSTTMVPLMMV